jgi:hypothetical protein
MKGFIVVATTEAAMGGGLMAAVSRHDQLPGRKESNSGVYVVHSSKPAMNNGRRGRRKWYPSLGN